MSRRSYRGVWRRSAASSINNHELDSPAAASDSGVTNEPTGDDFVRQRGGFGKNQQRLVSPSPVGAVRTAVPSAVGDGSSANAERANAAATTAAVISRNGMGCMTVTTVWGKRRQRRSNGRVPFLSHVVQPKPVAFHPP